MKETQRGRSRRRVLVAEDQLIQQKLLVAMLEQLGYEAVVVDQGREAVRAAGTGAYAAILMDCHMPVLDGFGATREIRALPDENVRRVPILAMTASASEEDREKCRRAGMSDCVSKPFSFAQLRTALEKWAADV